MAALLSPDSPYQYTPVSSSSDLEQGFRVLTLHPGKGDSGIECDVEHAILEKPPAYEALSYTWGDPKGPKCEVPCLGDFKADYYIKLDGKSFRVGFSLMSALKNLRLESSPRTMWVDAICINQADSVEKSHEVMAMGKIYGAATRVIAWLGEEDKFTTAAFDAIEELSWVKRVQVWTLFSERYGIPFSSIEADSFYVDYIQSGTPEFNKYALCIRGMETEPRKFFLDALWSQRPEDNEKSTDLSTFALDTFGSSRTLAQQLVKCPDDAFGTWISPAIVHAIDQTFGCRNYWSRLWIVQELELASDILFICGRRHLSMNDFHILLFIYTSIPDRGLGSETSIKSPIVPLQFSSYRLYGAKFGVKRPLNIWLDFTSNRGCVDARDRIFALLSVSAPIDININYTHSVEQVFMETTVQICNQMGLDFFLQYDHADSKERPLSPLNLPSWVPRLERRLRYPDDRSPQSTARYSCGGNLQTAVKARDGLYLDIEGYSQGKIDEIFPAWSGNDDIWKVAMTIRSALYPEYKQSAAKQLRRRMKNLRQNPEDIDGDYQLPSDWFFWTTLVRDTYPDQVTEKIDFVTGDYDKEVFFSNDVYTAIETPAPPCDRLLQHLSRCRIRTTFCVTSDKKLALVFGDAKKGDHIFLAPGASMPIILRPARAARERKRDVFRLGKREKMGFTVVGGAYVHEYMDGMHVRNLQRDRRVVDCVTLV